MNTLSNVDTRRGEATPPSVRLTPDTIPEAKSCRTGVSVDYVPDDKDFLERLDDMVEQAFDDQCTGANPRYPLMSEIRQMYLNAYYGEKHFTEMPKPTAKDVADVSDDAVKKAYRPGRKM